jgi:hypothetical protein
MEEQNFNLAPEKTKKSETKYWKFVIGFLGIIVIVGGGYFVWERYFSPQAKLNRETQKNYEKYLEWQKNYEKAMQEDAYGGKTPEETLKMFIEALKKEDVEMASRYFMLREDENINNEIINNLNNFKNNQKLSDIISIVSIAKFDEKSSSEDTKWFTVKNDKGLVEYSIILKLNKYSGVWKIESL